jgi:hypothetical protein
MMCLPRCIGFSGGDRSGEREPGHDPSDQVSGILRPVIGRKRSRRVVQNLAEGEAASPEEVPMERATRSLWGKGGLATKR